MRKTPRARKLLCLVGGNGTSRHGFLLTRRTTNASPGPDRNAVDRESPAPGRDHGRRGALRQYAGGAHPSLARLRGDAARGRHRRQRRRLPGGSELRAAAERALGPVRRSGERGIGRRMGTGIVGSGADRSPAVRAARRRRAGIARMHGRLRIASARDRRTAAGRRRGARRERPDRGGGALGLPALALQARGGWRVGGGGRGYGPRGRRLSQSALSVHRVADPCGARGACAPSRLPVRPLRAARQLAALLLAAAALTLAGGCATPPLDRYLLQSEEHVRIRGTSGLLSTAQSKAILDGLTSNAADGDALKRHIAVEEALAGNPLSTGNKVLLLEDGARTYADMLAAIRGAKQSLHMETYIFEDDDVGRQFAAALLERARAGVKVKLLYDAVGSGKTPPEFFKALADGGIAVARFNPLGPAGLLKGPVELNHRDHRKLTIVDGRIAYLGGINISSVYSPGGSLSAPGADRDPPFEQRAWRDTQVRIEGPVVADLQRAFLKQWAHVRAEAVSEGKEYFPAPAARGPTIVRAIEGAPSEDGVNVLYVALISAIEHAEKEVHITNAYFVPSRELVAALEGAALRGVDVRLVLPSRTDSWLTFHAGRSFYEALLEAGVKIFERKDRLLHAKTATIDGAWSTVGSTNLDWRSLADNDELNVVVLGPDFAAQLEAMFGKDVAESTEVTREAWHHRALKDRLREAAAVAWARLL